MTVILLLHPPVALPQSFSAISLDAPLAPEKLAPLLSSKRVVFVGETHDRYDNHRNQLEIIQSLHQLSPSLAIGVEYLEQRFQPVVDDFIAGKISEQDFLARTQYFKEWGYDYRLYAPIFRFARDQKIPLVALNVPSDLVFAVGKGGLAGLPKEKRDLLPPDIAPADDDYKSRLRKAFEQHGPGAKPGDFDHFVDAQLTWDESMAANAAAYLNLNPDRKMVILAGAGHLEFGSGIPKRLERRTHATYAIVLNGAGGDDLAPGLADYVLLTQPQDLPPAGTLGVSLMDRNGECQIKSLVPGGAADKAGLKRGDALINIDGHAVKMSGDVRLLLWDKKPGDRVSLTIRESHAFGRTSERKQEVELTAAPKTKQ